MHRRYELIITAVLALLGMGVTAGQGFVITRWVLLFWVPAVVLFLWVLLSPAPPNGVNTPVDVPNVVFDQTRHTEVTMNPPRGSRLDVWQLWFRNRPTVPQSRAIAQQLTADVEFCDSEWRQLLRFVGQWATTKMPEHVGWVGLSDRCDLAPVNTWAKLLLVGQGDDVLTEGRWSDPNSAGEREWVEVHSRQPYGLAGENLHHAPADGQHPRYALDPAASRVRVTLTALNMPERIFQFRLERDSQGAVVDVTPI